MLGGVDAGTCLFSLDSAVLACLAMTADAMVQNQDVACYLVTKLSWKGK